MVADLLAGARVDFSALKPVKVSGVKLGIDALEKHEVAPEHEIDAIRRRPRPMLRAELHHGLKISLEPRRRDFHIVGVAPAMAVRDTTSPMWDPRTYQGKNRLAGSGTALYGAPSRSRQDCGAFRVGSSVGRAAAF